MNSLEVDLAVMMRRMRLDAALDIGACLTLLLVVAIDVVVRCQQYEQYPYLC